MYTPSCLRRSLVLLVTAATVPLSVGCRVTADKAAPANVVPNERAKNDLSDKELIDRFHTLYYSRKPYMNTYLGIPSIQYPNDNWTMQEIIAEVRPDVIIETGTLNGGPSLFYADLLQNVRPRGEV